MTQQTARQALEQMAKDKQIFKNSNAYKTALEAINNPGIAQICGQSMGSGNYSSSKSWQAQTAIILRRIGLVVETFNVAPKGGNAGDRIIVFSEQLK